ncbi:unnamed protein product [Didymodactylos carnosus]|uniref:Major facilitator superfamily (MFS) profile domain-containing protein n=1 Tax=Didymodactylos carnosus TaxID=1234261 RepID=A0A814MJ61_9BILA|nr:unnamed protein product [Didymodactylos carnosus]CAF1080194.1 unnamed protein product [Didymodactylos carnosus]CAF3712107.1 unnamed protein product [Didymodactylos carnosus]CAF3846237.1 unnamed protein product [Didymodactylos carnosus]
MAEEQVFTKELVLTALASASGLLSVGWNSGCINSPEKYITKFMSDVYFHRSGKQLSPHVITLLWSITVSIFPFGGAVGGYWAGPVSRRFGRRKGLLLTNLLGIIAATLMAISKFVSAPELLIIGRLIIGIECGLYTGLCPMYLSEVSPKTIRGQVGSLTAISGSVGLMFAEIFSTPVLLGTENLWPVIMMLAAVPSVIQFILLQFCYESPRYLLINCNNELETRLVLSKLREKNNVDDEINEMKQEVEHLINERKVSIWELFTNKIYSGRPFRRQDPTSEHARSWWKIRQQPYQIMPEIRYSESVPEDVGKDPTGSDVFRPMNRISLGLAECDQF